MFKNIRNKMWLLGIAKHELYKSLMPTDTATLQSTMTAFERDMWKGKSWPFDNPETLSLFFSVWLGKQPVGEHLPDVRSNRFEEHPLAEPIPTDIIEGVKLYMDAAQLAKRAIERREIEIGIFEVEARMRMPTFVKASPATKRNFLKLRERLQVMFRLKSPHASNETEPQRDVVEALIERRENFSGQTAARNDQAWEGSPEHKTLTLVNQIASLCRSGVNEEDALRKLKGEDYLAKIEHVHAETTIVSVAEAFFRDTKDVPDGRVVYTVSFARDINWMKSSVPMRMANN